MTQVYAVAPECKPVLKGGHCVSVIKKEQKNCANITHPTYYPYWEVWEEIFQTSVIAFIVSYKFLIDVNVIFMNNISWIRNQSNMKPD